MKPLSLLVDVPACLRGVLWGNRSGAMARVDRTAGRFEGAGPLLLEPIRIRAVVAGFVVLRVRRLLRHE
jgi:hypothetical protein